MSRRAKYSHDVIQQALELRERGKGLAWIGQKQGMSTSAVDYHCLRGGAEKPGARAIKPRRPTPHVRAGVVVSSFSEARVGDALQLYSGDRFHPVLVGYAGCMAAGHVHFNFIQNTVGLWLSSGTELLDDACDLDRFAVTDGFDDWADLRGFWAKTHRLSEFDGWLTFWGDTFKFWAEV